MTVVPKPNNMEHVSHVLRQRTLFDNLQSPADKFEALITAYRQVGRISVTLTTDSKSPVLNNSIYLIASKNFPKTLAHLTKDWRTI